MSGRTAAAICGECIYFVPDAHRMRAYDGGVFVRGGVCKETKARCDRCRLCRCDKFKHIAMATCIDLDRARCGNKGYPVRCVDDGRVYASARHAEKAYRIPDSSLRHALVRARDSGIEKGRCRCKGWTFEWIDDRRRKSEADGKA